MTIANRFAPTLKCSPSLAMTMARKSRSARSVAWPSIEMTSASRLLAFVLKVSPSTPSPRSQASAPSLPSTGRLALAQDRQRGLAGIGLPRDVLALHQIPDLTVVGIETGCSRRDHLVDGLGQADAVRLHALDGLHEAQGVPGLKRPDLPVVAPAHGVIDSHHGVGDLGDAGAQRTRGNGTSPSRRRLPALPSSSTSLRTRSARILDLARSPCKSERIRPHPRPCRGTRACSNRASGCPRFDFL